MTRKTIGIGIVGCGYMGQVHARSYAATPGCRLVGYVNRTPGKARDLARELGGEAYPDLGAMLADERIDAVSICTDQAVHAEQAVAAAEAGRHVLCEKPLALTLDEMDAIDAAVRRSGVTLMVAHQMRFHPVIEQVRARMSRLGRCFHLSLEWGFRIKGHGGRCWADLRSGGFFMELGVHAADLAQHLMGPIAHVQAATLRLDPKRRTEDCTHCLLQFESNAIGSLLVTANHRAKRQGMLHGRVLGERGRIEFSIYPYGRAFNQGVVILDDGESVFVPDERRTALPRPTKPSRSKTFRGFYDIYEREVAAFLHAVRTGQPPPITLDDGRRAVEVVLAAYDRQGRVAQEPAFAAPRTQHAYRSGPDCHPPLRQGKRRAAT